MRTSIRICLVIPISGFALLLPSGIAFLPDFGLPYARTLEIANHEGLFIRISSELYDPNIFRPHFMYCTYDIFIEEEEEMNEEEIITYMILVIIVIIYSGNIFGRNA